MAVTDEIGIASFAKFGNTGQLVVGEFLDDDVAELLNGLESTTVSDLDAIELGLIEHESPTLALFALGPCPGDELTESGSATSGHYALRRPATRQPPSQTAERWPESDD